jgi:hypothetical protein
MKDQPFDVLLTDLNIGSPADGFILVTAMRRLQPSASTFILTGYPDSQTALEAIREQDLASSGQGRHFAGLQRSGGAGATGTIHQSNARVSCPSDARTSVPAW